MRCFRMIWAVCLVLFFTGAQSSARDLPQIKASGVIRHIGVPYANFITGSGDGLDVEVVKLFAHKIGVRYEYVRSSWGTVIGDLTGKKVQARGDDIQILGKVPERGDLIANGFTILAWRQKIVDYSIPTFPTQVWVVAGARAAIQPIDPSGDLDLDILRVKGRLARLTVLGKAATCLDPTLYAIRENGALIKFFQYGLNDLAPAVINGDADATLLDVPDALIALEKWPGKIKVIGPVSEDQKMGVAFAKTSGHLRQAFNRFLSECKADGTYRKLVEKYYPGVFNHYPGFFN